MAVEAYLAALPDDRRSAIEAVRATVLEALPDGFEEALQYGILAYHVPLEVFSKTYNRQPLAVAALASQKRYMSLYLMGLYAESDQAWLRERWAATGKTLDMGKSCVRFKRLDDLPHDVVGEAIARVRRRSHRRARARARAIGRPRGARPTHRARAKPGSSARGLSAVRRKFRGTRPDARTRSDGRR